jgi:hypothetical protein
MVQCFSLTTNQHQLAYQPQKPSTEQLANLRISSEIHCRTVGGSLVRSLICSSDAKFWKPVRRRLCKITVFSIQLVRWAENKQLKVLLADLCERKTLLDQSSEQADRLSATGRLGAAAGIESDHCWLGEVD